MCFGNTLNTLRSSSAENRGGEDALASPLQTLCVETVQGLQSVLHHYRNELPVLCGPRARDGLAHASAVVLAPTRRQLLVEVQLVNVQSVSA